MDSTSTSRSFPGFERLFLLGGNPSSTHYRGRISVDVHPFALTRGAEPSKPAEVRRAMGAAEPTDAIWTTSVAPVIVHERVLALLAAFTGWKTYAVEVFDAKERAVPGYHGLAVVGRCGEIDDSRSQKLDKIYPGGVFPVWRGLYFDEASWDGSDLFMPGARVGWIFAVKEVADAFRKAKVRNVVFDPLTEMERTSLLG
jgi:hypothetical protein